MRYVCSLLMTVALAVPSYANWGGGLCARSGASWREIDKGVWYYGEPVTACWYAESDEWYDRVGGKWVGPKTPPWRKPLTGVEPKKLTGGDHITVGGGSEIRGKPDSALPADDSGKGFVVVIGDDNFIATAQTQLAAVSGNYFVEYFHPDEWQVQELGYLPGVWIVGPRDAAGRGKAVSYSKSVDGILTALRKADPSFDPAKVPDLSKDELIDHLRQIPPCAWAAAGVCAFLFLTRKK